MKSLKRGSLRAALCLSVATAALGLLGSAEASAKTLVYCSEAAPEGFDPALYSTNSTWDASSKPIYSRLVEFENGTTNLLPGLAESWTVSDDMLTYTFKLRPGVKFQTTDYFTPTRDMNADDVVFSFDRQYRTDNPWHQYVTGANYEMYAGMDMQATVKDISKVDGLTVKLVLSQPNASILSNLAMDLGSIVSKEYADKLAAAGTPEKLNSEPIGTGPFQFVGYQQDAVVRFKANPTYWGAKPKLDELVFAITADASTRMQRLQAGECHVAAYPAPADVPGLKADPNLVVVEKPGLNVAYLAYNTLTPPFDKIEVRKALNMAIDKKTILQAVFQDLGEVAKNPIPPAMWGYNDAVVDDPYDPVAAKKMLDDAGVKDLKMKVWAMPVSRPYMPNARRVAELIQSDFQKVGVSVEVVSYEWAEYLKRARDKQRDGAIILGGTSDNGDPDNLLSYFFSCAGVGGANMANWCHQPFEDLLQKARTTVDQAERAKLYEQAQLIFKEQAPWATLDHSTVSLPMSKKVSGYVMDPLGSHRFETVDLAE
ncbi:dipeptide transport system substrate-binding protein [Aminobacter lissarensis]|uniref:Dipeptide transport system substrate-binding protein n=1 Tax=Aminobacter carboxidus TaxID=376165 RepID=A0A8E1WC49_9HYPH|nr:ABC transporter substrate-binding protein [Aminobacter lissarensis]MBB6465543.1 dipeptide transport system substrate-binding protein [Aminobacter lissarensis]